MNALIPFKILRYLRKKSRPFTINFRYKANPKIIYLDRIPELKFFISKKEIIAESNSYLEDIHNILGSNPQKVTDWHTDFKSNHKYPLKHYTKIKFEDPFENHDKKIPWDLSRCHHLPILNKAYELTKYKKYQNKIQQQIEDWIKNNPIEYGINWCCTMEVAIRAINWIHSVKYLEKKPIKELYNHGIFIKNNLEWNKKRENHYSTNLLGLLYLGILFDKKTWIKFSLKRLEKEITLQFNKDGTNRENSINYHRLTTEIYLLAYLICEHNKIQLSENYKEQLIKALKFIINYTKPNSLAPNIGDNDNGRILNIWNKEINNHTDLPNLLNIKDKPTPIKAYKDYTVIKTKDYYLILRHGSNSTGHTHNDQLSFELNIKGNDIIIDRGTAGYTSDYKLRNEFRSINSHNTISIGKEPNKIEWTKPFNIENKTQCIREINGNKIILSHNSFNPLIHQREITLNKRSIEIKDTMCTDFKLNLYLNPKLKIKQMNNKLIFNNCTVEFNNKPEIKETTISPSYGLIVHSKKIEVNAKNQLITLFKF